MPGVKVKLDLTWVQMGILKEIEEKHYDSKTIVKMLKKIAERNIEIICKLFEFIKENGALDDIKSFIEKNW